MVDILPTNQERQIIEQNAEADVRQLALSLKAGDGVRVQYVLQQVAGRQAMSRKVPSWNCYDGLVYPVHLSVEQCSSEMTASYKAGLAKRLIGSRVDTRLVDLTGGLGVDFSFMARCFDRCTYIERNEELASIVVHNMPIIGLGRAECLCDDGVSYIQSSDEHFTCIFLDPARRDEHGGKTVHLADCTPNLVELEDTLLAKADFVVAKLSPMLDISEALSQLRHVSEVHVVSVDNECKELLLVMCKEAEEEPVVYTENNGQAFSFIRSEERSANCSWASSVGRFLYEPNASIMKTGAFKLVACRYGLSKLHVSSHLYTGDTFVGDFPGRSFEVLSEGSLGKNTLPATLVGLSKANITVRNYPQKVDDIRKKLKLRDGGDDYVFATTITPDRKIIVHCKKAVEK